MRISIVLVSVFCLPFCAHAQDLRATLFADADSAMEQAQQAEADVLAPDTFQRAMEAYRDADEDFGRGRNIDRIGSSLEDATNYFVDAVEATEIARITLASLIKTRDDASKATAETFAAELWQEAEDIFDSAARRLEDGDIRSARTRGEEAEVLYRDAELTAIKAQYLSDTRALLAQAEQIRVPRFAPQTFATAQSLLQQAELELSQNRYDTDYPRSLAQQANYEARHAIYLAEQIRQHRDNDGTEEDIILRYEQPLTQIAASADIAARLDRGAEPVVTEVVTFIEELGADAREAQIDLVASRERVVELEDEIRELDEQLGGVSQERVALVQRLEAEARIREQFSSIEQMFDREEARVSREGNNIVLRLVGLTFASGESMVGQQYRSLLGKVSQSATVFPRSQIVIEGHTDSYGSDGTNLTLSRERAEAVRTYLTSEFAIPAFRISAGGYGETRPISNNETTQGRTRNRRIDVRIEPQID